MKILYDYPSFSQKHGGVSRYVCEIIKNLSAEVDAQMSILVTDNLYIREVSFLKAKHLITDKKFKGKQKAETIINTIYSNYKIALKQYDIFHATFSDFYFVKKISKPVVITIHDMINEKLSEYQLSHAKHIARKKQLIYNSAHIIAVSENTKKDILEVYPIDPAKISVIYHGGPIFPEPDHLLKNEFGEYILYVGRRTRYKNFPFFAQSIAPLLKETKNLKLVCVGPAFNTEEEQLLVRSGVREQVLAISVTDELLYSLYRHALVFVFPSIFEGFGIPILEAFANNCPVCLSNSSCFPEIAGNAGLYFDPYDAKSIYDSVQKIISDKNLADELRLSGKERLLLFSWGKAANQTLDVYKKIA